jgi:hypothetical protein
MRRGGLGWNAEPGAKRQDNSNNGEQRTGFSMATLLLFFDGIGIGRDDPSINPFAAVRARRLSPLWGGAPDEGASFRALDATLGIAGLPQSATGQTTLLTGINAARLMGRHVQGIPGPTLVHAIDRESLFLKLVRAGLRPTFANAFTRPHLEARRPRWSATTRTVMASGVPFRMLDREERQDAALPHDYTGEWWIARGMTVKHRTAEQAARVLEGLVTTNDVVLYEYFLTDLVGHRGDRDQKLLQARRVEALVDAVLAAVDLDLHRVVVISDHGNLEESDHQRHTRNPVPLLAWGAGSSDLVRRVSGLEGLTPALIDELTA